MLFFNRAWFADELVLWDFLAGGDLLALLVEHLLLFLGQGVLLDDVGCVLAPLTRVDRELGEHDSSEKLILVGLET